MAIVPMVRQGQSVGVVVLAHPDVGYFDERELAETESIVRLLASLIEIFRRSHRQNLQDVRDELTGVLSR